MKRRTVIFTILFFVGISTYGQLDNNGNYLQSNTNIRLNLKSTSSIVEIPNSDFQFDSIRALSEINLSNNAEAYPWISNDGLRLYFTLETDSVDIIVVSEREHVDSVFGTPQNLSINSSLNDNSSLWLTDDELDIYFIIRESYGSLTTSLYHSHRNSLEDEFGVSVQINLQGNISGSLLSPSFTTDMERLYAFNYNSGVGNILIFNKIDIDKYQLADTLSIPDGYKPGPGKLGHNDLKYYLSLTDNSVNEMLFVYTRESTQENFDSIYYLNNDIINNSLFRNHHPAISNNGNYFLFTRSSENSWSSNDLYIAYNNIFASGLDYDILNNAIRTYLNPTSDYVTFEFNKAIVDVFTISIYTINGIHVESKTISTSSSKIVIPTTKYNSGVYIYEITSSGSYIGNGKFVVGNR